MSGSVVVDTNLLLLLVVGSASKNFIGMHKRLKDDFTEDDFDLLGLIIAEFSDIIVLPHILAETSNLMRHIGNPALEKIQGKLRTLIESATEFPVQSVFGARRDEFNNLGLTDAVMLHVCAMSLDGNSPTLITTDDKLANAANSLGYSVIDFKQVYQTR